MKLKMRKLTFRAIPHLLHFNWVVKIDCARSQRALNISHIPDCTALSPCLRSVLESRGGGGGGGDERQYVCAGGFVLHQ